MGKNEFRTEAFATVPDWDQGNQSQIGMRTPIGRWSIDHDSVTANDVIAIASQDDPRVVGQLRDDMIEFRTQSMLIIPIWLRDSCIGVLNLYSRRSRAFTADQKMLAATLAKQAANAIQNAKTHENERARRSQQEVLVRFAAAATSSLDLNRSMQALCEAIHTVTGVDSGDDRHQSPGCGWL